MPKTPPMNFDEEYEILKQWLNQKWAEYVQEEEQEIQEGNYGRDGQANYIRQQNVQEYNRRLIALKEKYGVK